MKAVKLKLMVVKEGATFGYDPIYTPQCKLQLQWEVLFPLVCSVYGSTGEIDNHGGEVSGAATDG